MSCHRNFCRWPRLAAVAGVLWLLAAALPAVAGTNDLFVFKTWSVEQGLPQAAVRAISQTQDGYLWAGTFAGLARFDGVTFTSFTAQNTPALQSDRISSLCEDHAGTLWIGTAEGVVRYAGGKFEHLSAPEQLRLGSVRDIVEDREGRLWVITDTAVFRGTGNAFVEAPFSEGHPPQLVRSIHLSPRGELWLTGYSGVWRWSGTRFERSKISLSSDPRIAVVDRDERIWIMDADARLFVFAPSGEALRTPDLIRTNYYARIAPDGHGGVVSGLVNAALIRFTGMQGVQIHPPAASKDVLIIALVMAPDDNLWVGLDGGGLVQLRPRSVEVVGVNQGLPTAFVNCLHEDEQGRMYLGTWGHAMVRYAGGRVEGLLTPGIHNVTTILPNPGGGLWIGTFGAVYEWREPGATKAVSRLDQITQLISDGKDGFWAGTEQLGVEHFTPRGSTFFSHTNGLRADRVSALTPDGTGGVWVGTIRGLNRIRDGVVTSIPFTNRLGSSHIRALWVDPRGNLWAGFYRGGLMALREGKHLLLTQEDGLPDNTVQVLSPGPQGDLWIGTMRGLLRVSMTNLEDRVAGRTPRLRGRLYAEAQGLIHPKIGCGYTQSACVARDGRMWFVSKDGLVIVNPDDPELDPPTPQVHIEEVRLDGQTFEPGGQGSLPLSIRPGVREVEVRYTGLHFADPGRLEFRYRVKGVTRGWSYVGSRRSAYFDRLPPGDHLFEVMASPGAGTWAGEPDRLLMRVEPNWWQTRAFRWSSALLAAGLLYALYRLRISGLERRRRLQDAFSRQLIESQEAERKRIASELHDSLGQNLLVVRSLALLGAQGAGEMAETRKEFEGIAEAAANALSEVRTISHALRPVELDRLGLTQALKACVARVSDSCSIRLTSDIEEVDTLLTPARQIGLYRIVQEALNNTVKHSQASEASVTLLRDGDRISLTISDNGKGFDPPDANGVGLGLPGITERVRLLGGEAQLRSSPGHGTRWNISVPVQPRNPDFTPG